MHLSEGRAPADEFLTGGGALREEWRALEHDFRTPALDRLVLPSAQNHDNLGFWHASAGLKTKQFRRIGDGLCRNETISTRISIRSRGGPDYG